jgi:hypothetical protein
VKEDRGVGSMRGREGESGVEIASVRDKWGTKNRNVAKVSEVLPLHKLIRTITYTRNQSQIENATYCHHNLYATVQFLFPTFHIILFIFFLF